MQLSGVSGEPKGDPIVTEWRGEGYRTGVLSWTLNDQTRMIAIIAAPVNFFSSLG